MCLVPDVVNKSEMRSNVINRRPSVSQEIWVDEHYPYDESSQIQRNNPRQPPVEISLAPGQSRAVTLHGGFSNDKTTYDKKQVNAHPTQRRQFTNARAVEVGPRTQRKHVIEHHEQRCKTTKNVYQREALGLMGSIENVGRAFQQSADAKKMSG